MMAFSKESLVDNMNGRKKGMMMEEVSPHSSKHEMMSMQKDMHYGKIDNNQNGYRKRF
jgi:hypothetical protein